MLKVPEPILTLHNHIRKGRQTMIDASNNAMGVNPKGKLKDVYSAKENEESERL